MIKTVGIDNDITVADKIKFILSTTDSNDCIYNYTKVELPTKLNKEMDELWESNKDLINNGELPPFEKFSSIRCKLANSKKIISEIKS